MNNNIKYLVESFIDDEEEIIDVDINFNRDEFVDLGLPSGTLWAKHNLLNTGGVFGYGKQFAWGETRKSANRYFTKDNYEVSPDLIELHNYNDAAYIATNGKMRMPTEEEVIELIENTEVELINGNGDERWGFKFYSNNNTEELFIPFCYPSPDDGFFDLLHSEDEENLNFYLWTSNGCNKDKAICFTYDHHEDSPITCPIERWLGLSIRPVANN